MDEGGRSCFAQELAGKRPSRSRPEKKNNEVEAEGFVLRRGSCTKLQKSLKSDSVERRK